MKLSGQNIIEQTIAGVLAGLVGLGLTWLASDGRWVDAIGVLLIGCVVGSLVLLHVSDHVSQGWASRLRLIAWTGATVYFLGTFAYALPAAIATHDNEVWLMCGTAVFGAFSCGWLMVEQWREQSKDTTGE